MGADGRGAGGHDHRAARGRLKRGQDPRRRLEALEAVFSALAHPARRQMLLAVHFRGGSMAAGDIAARFKHAWPTTTRHLHVLADAGLLRAHRKGRQRVYELNRQRLEVVLEWIAWFRSPGQAGGR